MIRALLPYASADGIFKSISYRAHSNEQFRQVDVEHGSFELIVRSDDLRTIPQHQLKVTLDLDALKPAYERAHANIKLVLLARDSILRREVTLGVFPVDSIPETIDVSRKTLETTGLRDELSFELIVVMRELAGSKKNWPTQGASRLAEFRLTLRNPVGGPSFPYKRVSPEELKKRNLPAETALYLYQDHSSPAELLVATDAVLSSLFEVWVHEKLWSAIQNDKSPSSSQLRMAAVTITTTNLILSAVEPLIKDGSVIEEGSCVARLLKLIEKSAHLGEGHLVSVFQTAKSTLPLQPYIQHAWKFVSNTSKVDEELVD